MAQNCEIFYTELTLITETRIYSILGQCIEEEREEERETDVQRCHHGSKIYSNFPNNSCAAPVSSALFVHVTTVDPSPTLQPPEKMTNTCTGHGTRTTYRQIPSRRSLFIFFSYIQLCLGKFLRRNKLVTFLLLLVIIKVLLIHGDYFRCS